MRADIPFVPMTDPDEMRARSHRLRAKSLAIHKRGMKGSVHNGWRRKWKRADRLRDLSIALWLKAEGLDPHGPAEFDREGMAALARSLREREGGEAQEVRT